jgi:hypothetical protein
VAVFKFSGGPLQAGEIYVERKADCEVVRSVKALDYAHLIAPRQMGKTSLLYRLSRQLREWGWRCVYVDLSELKATSEIVWYQVLGRRIGDQLTPEHLPEFTGPNDLKTYLATVLASDQSACPIVLMLDEIGNAQRLVSCEQFFLTLRSMYRQPVDYPALKDFTLVLAGTIDPDSLVKGTSNSPFNYGERVPLLDFNATETRQLVSYLASVFDLETVPDAVHTRIYEWTSGQPYLTQKVCAILERWHMDEELDCPESEDVDRAVREYLLAPDPLKSDSNISHILDGLRDERLRNLFRSVMSGNPIQDRRAMDLYLLGVVKRVRGHLTVRNRIYVQVLDAYIVRENQMPTLNESHALLIGVGDYAHPRFASLLATIGDAQAITAVLTDPARCAYPSANVHVLTGEQATTANIRKTLKALAESTTPKSTVFIYFSGHGGRALENGNWRTFLCPCEADPDDLTNTAIPGDEFSTLLAAIPAQKMLVILDACHASGSAELKAADGMTVWKAGLPDDYYEALSQGSGRVVIASSKEDQYSYVRKQGDLSLFTWHLREALSGKAAVRGDGLIHVLDVFHYVNEAVQADEPKQVPILKLKDLDLNFPIALDRGGKGVGAAPAIGTTPVVDIREQIVRDPISGARALSEYLKTRPEWAGKRNEVDLKRADLERIQHELELFGPDPGGQAAKNRSVFFLLKMCLELERPGQ